MGFVGSTGKAAKPIPCSVDEYERLINDAAAAEYAARIAAGESAIKKEEKEVVKQPEPKPVLKEAPVKVGQDVEILSGTFAGEKCKVIAINLEKQTVKVEYELFGRTNAFEVGFDDIKLAK
ncbi:MAG: KOW motif-containing protein [Mycoplasmoidaceae bacterium]|nr:KOW motif-containing protein [Mycoplasmoidaceae bacterium]